MPQNHLSLNIFNVHNFIFTFLKASVELPKSQNCNLKLFHDSGTSQELPVYMIPFGGTSTSLPLLNLCHCVPPIHHSPNNFQGARITIFICKLSSYPRIPLWFIFSRDYMQHLL